MDDDEHDNEVLEENRSGPEEEEEEQHDPIQEDHVEVTICRFPCVPTVNIHNARTVRLVQ
jgi:hypothetical protein